MTGKSWAPPDGPKGEELAEVQRGIDQTMGAILRQGAAPMGPSSMLGPAPVRPKVQAPTEKPIEQYHHIDLIDRLVNAELPHGTKSRAK